MHNQTDLIYAKKVKGKGRGVFAGRPIRKGSIIEKVPKFFVPVELIVDGYANPLVSKIFYEEDRRTLAILLGYGLLYNHSFQPNAIYKDGPNHTKIYRALRDIDADEEICVNYNGNPKDQSPVGFAVK